MRPVTTGICNAAQAPRTMLLTEGNTVLIGLLAAAFFVVIVYIDSEPSVLALYGVLIFVVGHTIGRLRARAPRVDGSEMCGGDGCQS